MTEAIPDRLSPPDILLFPEIDAAAAASLLPRLAFYLWPVRDRIGGIAWAGLQRPDPWQFADNPDFDPVIAAHVPEVVGKLQWCGEAFTSDALPEHAMVLVWQERALKRALSLTEGPIFVVDPESLHEGDQFIEVGTALTRGEGAAERASAALLRLRRQIAERGHSRTAYVLGTGPGLSRVAAMETGDAIVVACNSIVRNTALLEHVRPAITVAADPIFHSGFSAYAGAFRRHLIEALDRFDMMFVIQERDEHIYRAYLPERLHDRILAIPVVYETGLHMDLDGSLKVHATQNVLTMFLLPLGFWLADDIRIVGCDGRALQDKVMFWKHDQASQLGEHMAGIRRCHPGFFQIDQDSYYLLHCETVRRWLTSAEQAGKRSTNVTPSHIPALLARSAQELDNPARVAADEFRIAIGGRLAYWHRAARVRYGAWFRSDNTPLWQRRAVASVIRVARRGLRLVGLGKAI